MNKKAMLTPDVMKKTVRPFELNGKYDWKKEAHQDEMKWGTSGTSGVPTGNSGYGNDMDTLPD